MPQSKTSTILSEVNSCAVHVGINSNLTKFNSYPKTHSQAYLS